MDAFLVVKLILLQKIQQETHFKNKIAIGIISNRTKPSTQKATTARNWSSLRVDFESVLRSLKDPPAQTNSNMGPLGI